MDLECLIKVLEEKGIIKEYITEYDANDNPIVTSYTFEFEEVVDKILESHFYPDLTEICAGIHKKSFCIIDIQALRDNIIYLLKDEEFIVPSRGFKNVPNKVIMNLFYEDDDFHIEEFKYGCGMKIINDKLIRDKKAKAENHKREVLDFLNSLP